MSDEQQIHAILIDRDIRAFVNRDWPTTADDFAPDFTAYSGATGELRLTYPTLDAYRDHWIRGAEQFADMDTSTLSAQMHGAQRLTRIEVTDDRALVTKVFDGSIDGPDGPVDMGWTSHFFLRRDAGRWKVTGFVGFLPGRDAE